VNIIALYSWKKIVPVALLANCSVSNIFEYKQIFISNQQIFGLYKCSQLLGLPILLYNFSSHGPLQMFTVTSPTVFLIPKRLKQIDCTLQKPKKCGFGSGSDQVPNFEEKHMT